MWDEKSEMIKEEKLIKYIIEAVIFVGDLGLILLYIFLEFI